MEESDGNKSNFTDEFPLLNTSTSHINKREQINRVEITKSRGNARRWRVRTRNTHHRNIVAFINGPIFEDGIFVVPVSLLVFATRGVKVSARSRHRERFFCVIVRVRFRQSFNNILAMIYLIMESLFESRVIIA